MAAKKPFIPAAARHDRIASRKRISVDRTVRELLAAGVKASQREKRDGKQGALDGTPDLVLGGQLGAFESSIPDIPQYKATEKSTDKAQNPDKPKDGKEYKEGDEKGKDYKEKDETGKLGPSENVEFGFLRYGRPETLDVLRLSAAVVAHSARGLAKGPMV